MKILTTNSAGKAKFGGIHTRNQEQIKYSPQHTFHVVELNKEKKYILKNNVHIHRVNVPELTNGKDIFDILKSSRNYKDFNFKIEKVVNEYQNNIKEVNPDIILIPGTSLTSYSLFKAARREGLLHRSLHQYVGVLEKEIANYTGDTRYLLGLMGKEFVSELALKNVTYLFPSLICKKTVEDIHKIKIKKSNVVWNGISEDFVKGDFNRNLPAELTFGYIGRVHSVKNPMFFLNLNDNFNSSTKLKIITDLYAAAGKPTGKALLGKLTNGEVFYYAPRSKAKLKEFYESQISANIVPSFFETYCNGAIESIVCGTPTLLSDQAGATEVLKKYNLENFIFSIYNPDSFNNALEEAKKINFTIDKELSREIYEDLSWEKVIKRYNEIIESI